jgi:hypothetical protein
MPEWHLHTVKGGKEWLKSFIAEQNGYMKMMFGKQKELPQISMRP